MNPFSKLTENEFTQAVLRDARESMRISQKGKLISEDAVVDEYQFYLQGVGFHLAHALTWMKQLDSAVELLTNYDYSKNISASRADHLIYNIENYLIRLNSTNDRMLQLTNAVFHLGTNEEHVTHSVIIANVKVQHRPQVVSKLKATKKHLEKYAQDRNTIIHKHSLLDEKLRRIELFYNEDLLDHMTDEQRKRTKAFRANYLREYVIARKAEFHTMNSVLSDLVDAFLGSLVTEYQHQKQQFSARGF
jgi:Cthe_2314-like HEPN